MKDLLHSPVGEGWVSYYGFCIQFSRQQDGHTAGALLPSLVSWIKAFHFAK
jgi:hypothetical protein